jgi:hypothetical protein
MRPSYALVLALLVTGPSVIAQSDLCTGSVLVTPGTYVADGPFSGNGATQPDAANADWYSFDPNDPGYMTVTSCGDGVRDTRVFVHTGGCGALVTLGGDDDGCPTGYPPGNSLLANVPVTPGNLYFIEWDDRWSGQGFTWDLLFHTCPNALPSFTADDTSFTVEWTEGDPGDQYAVEYGPEGFTPGTGTIIAGVIGGAPFPLSIGGLSAGTDYDVYITMNCAGGDVSPFTGPWPLTTSGVQIVPNDECNGAIAITCGDTLSGNTTFALPDGAADCGTSVSAPGVWYTLTGITGTVTVTTCPGADFDTKINVYSGSCGTLTCIGGDDDECDLLSLVNFNADASTTYYILVQGYNGTTGEFQVTAVCNACATPTNLQAFATNDEADLYWTSVNPGSTFSVEYGPAGFLQGTGTVITGVNGIDGPPVNLPNLSAGTDYDVYLSEDCGGGEVSLSAFTAFGTLLQPPAVNALCTDALPIACGDAVNGSTVNGIVASGPTCAGADITARGVWYTLTGTGDAITLSTCNQASFDSKISVYSGTCNALLCQGGNDDGAGCGTTSTITFPSQSGLEYLVLVHGYQSGTGTFTLTMTCAPPCTPVAANDECASAETIAPQAIGNCVATDGDNSCAYGSAQANPPCDPFANIQDVWYQFNTGPDEDHTLTFTLGTATSISAALYTLCGSLVYVECFTGIAAPIQLPGLALNTTYYLRVWNAGGPEAGTFTLCDEAALITDIAENTGDELRLMPVPASDRLTVEGLSADVTALNVIDLQGRSVMHVAVNGNARYTIDVNTLSTGTYLLRTIGGQPRTARFIVE